jgi:hypothetical protein
MEIFFTYQRGVDGWYTGFLNGYPFHWVKAADLEKLKVALLKLRGAIVKQEAPATAFQDSIWISEDG